jgi:nucleoside-diphosphate kinase
MVAEERTLIVVKPDAVKRGLVGEVISRFERKGFRIVDMKLINVSKDVAEEFYSPHSSKPFFKELVAFFTSGPVVAAILEGREAISVARTMIGATDSAKALPGTVRGDLSLGLTDNAIHASDSRESFERESRILFGK